MEIQDCKVRVSNVDSQESHDNIVVQVIGEMSLKAAPHRKFTQTFVLAKQPNGYFVLNDIFRYLIEEEVEEYHDEAAAGPGLTPEQPMDAESTTLTSSEAPVKQQPEAPRVDKKPQEEGGAADSSTSEAPVPNGVSQSSSLAVTDDAPAAAIKTQETGESSSQEPVTEASPTEDLQPEKPNDPDPTPISSPPKPTKATPAQPPVPAQPPKPAAPRTWATMVASNSQSKSSNPSTPAPSSTSQQAPPQPSEVTPSTTQPASLSTATPNESRKRVPQTNGTASSGWQTQEGGKRQGRQQSVSGDVSGGMGAKLGYIKNVNEKVDASLLKQTLSSFGPLAYFDVSRPKVKAPSTTTQDPFRLTKQRTQRLTI